LLHYPEFAYIFAAVRLISLKSYKNKGSGRPPPPVT